MSIFPPHTDEIIWDSEPNIVNFIWSKDEMAGIIFDGKICCSEESKKKNLSCYMKIALIDRSF